MAVIIAGWLIVRTVLLDATREREDHGGTRSEDAWNTWESTSALVSWGAGGETVTVNPGLYRVDVAGDSQLALIADDGTATLVEAERGGHPLELDAPLAVAFEVEEGDRRVAVLLPGGGWRWWRALRARRRPMCSGSNSSARPASRAPFS